MFLKCCQLNSFFIFVKTSETFKNLEKHYKELHHHQNALDTSGFLCIFSVETNGWIRIRVNNSYPEPAKVC